MARHTVLVTSPLARRELQLAAARAAAHGRQILSPPQAAARLAGGFLQPIDRNALLEVLHQSLADRRVEIGELEQIRELPGTVRAAATTLMRVWSAQVNLSRRADSTSNPRIAAVAALEAAVLKRLPPSMRRPQDLVDRALQRLAFAPWVLGPIELRGVPGLDPVWRSFLVKLAEVVPVTWQLGHFPPPPWLTNAAIAKIQDPGARPEILRVSCANPRHEALEALRWARELMASGQARPQEIAIAAPATQEWDDHLAAISADGNLPLAFLHGRPALTTRDGQAAAAVAEVVLTGLSQTRVRRAVGLTRSMTVPTRALPRNWYQILQPKAPLLRAEQWYETIAAITEWPEGQDFGADLRTIIELLDRGVDDAAEIGEKLLAGRALSIWRKALKEGPARALESTLTGIRLEETMDPCTSVLWCQAADIAACPRPYVRLLGLASRGWPRTQSEDPLLPAHVIDPTELDPVPVPERDRRDFRTNLRAACRQVVLSRFRRSAEGRQAGESALLHESGVNEEQYLRRERIPQHAVSEADRLLARSVEFTESALAKSTINCWRNWLATRLTPHDGLIREHHPVIERVLRERFSATRLRKLARDPLGFLWQYALGWNAPVEDEEPLVLDPLSFGGLVHRVLELAVGQLETDGGFGGADFQRVANATSTALDKAAEEFVAVSPVPPRLMWQSILAEVHQLTVTALSWDEEALSGQRAYAEVPFGDPTDVGRAGGPWNPGQVVAIPNSDLFITGRIDRLDIAGDWSVARVTDYKTGRLPKNPIGISGGAELQRCIYAYAVHALLGQELEVAARLLYPRDGGRLFDLEDPRATLETVARYLVIAREKLRSGLALVGPESGERDDDPLTFALPGNRREIYLETKRLLAAERLVPLPELWEMP